MFDVLLFNFWRTSGVFHEIRIGIEEYRYGTPVLWIPNTILRASVCANFCVFHHISTTPSIQIYVESTTTTLQKKKKKEEYFFRNLC